MTCPEADKNASLGLFTRCLSDNRIAIDYDRVSVGVRIWKNAGYKKTILIEDTRCLVGYGPRTHSEHIVSSSNTYCMIQSPSKSLF